MVAVADGTLSNVGWNSLGGWRLWVRDTSGNGFYYAHLSAYSPIAKEGASVTRGTVLGYVGNTGDARAPPPTCTSRSTRAGADRCRPTRSSRAGRGRAEHRRAGR